MEYAQSSGLIDTLRNAADSNMSGSVSAENGSLIARYTVNADVNDASQANYFNAVIDKMNTLCTQLDAKVYDMKIKTGVTNAVLEIFVVDKNNLQFYANYVD